MSQTNPVFLDDVVAFANQILIVPRQVALDGALDEFGQAHASLGLCEKVLPNGAEVIEKLTCGCLKHVGLPLSLVTVRIHDDVDALGFNAHIDVGASHNGIAVIVDYARV